jgi:hypothetical protein
VLCDTKDKKERRKKLTRLDLEAKQSKAQDTFFEENP